MIRDKLQKDSFEALKARDNRLVDVLRFLKSLIDKKEMQLPPGSLTEIEETKILNKELKDKEESKEMFAKAGRNDLVEQLDYEIEIVKRYLPELISEELIDLIDKNEKICKYIDIPFQHVSTKLLKLMNRKSDYNSICKLIEYIKSKPSNIAIRSSFILGFPKETNKDYLEVITFLKKYKLNNVGFFKYSREEGTLASKYSRQVNELVKKLRVKKAYKVQNKIAYANNKKLIGETVLAVCEGFNENNGVFILRNQYNSPNIDTAMFDYSDELKIGEFYNVTVSGFCGLDLICEIVKGEKL